MSFPLDSFVRGILNGNGSEGQTQLLLILWMARQELKLLAHKLRQLLLPRPPSRYLRHLQPRQPTPLRHLRILPRRLVTLVSPLILCNQTPRLSVISSRLPRLLVDQ